MYLITYDNQTFTYNNGWQSIGTLPPTANDFTTSHLVELETIPESAWQEIPTDYAIYYLSNADASSLEITYEKVTLPTDEEVIENYKVSYQEKKEIEQDLNIQLDIIQQQLSYPEGINNTLTVERTQSIYDELSKSYQGIGVVETELETLPEHRTSLVLYAEHEQATFEYSLDNGESWYAINIEKIEDISDKEGNELIIRVTLPTEDATLSALSYGWA